MYSSTAGELSMGVVTLGSMVASAFKGIGLRY